MKNILLIDDDETTNFLTKITIKKTNLGIVIHECLNGKEGVNFFEDLQINPNATTPDIILLDLNMPILDGWQFLDEYKKFNATASVYIMSSSNYPEDIQNASNYPVVKGYIVKPLTTEKAIELLTD
jgi:CheY-like chemotaxis protein